MTFRLKFHPNAKKEYDGLDNSIKEQFKKKLKKRLENPRVPKDELAWPNHYKIKLRTIGYRLVYEVIENEVVVYVIAVGKRDKGAAYDIAEKRIKIQ